MSNESDSNRKTITEEFDNVVTDLEEISRMLYKESGIDIKTAPKYVNAIADIVGLKEEVLREYDSKNGQSPKFKKQ